MKQGEKVAIVGENGSGKTTFILLLSGLYRPQKGKITFVGKDLMDNLGLMRRATSFVFQDFGRYQITVADNIRIGNLYRDLSDQEIKLAAKRSGADEFIEKLDQKYNTFLGTLEEGHTDLSGG
ncbi:MAG: ABC transporter ATP-binding protein, partial [Firmicutes bacterium]|nr:ABC transporter ATP-binding protein [Bacillota bacterium]